MSPEEIAALNAEVARLGRPLTEDEAKAVREAAAHASGSTSIPGGGDAITATPLETRAERAARLARESAVERDRAMAAISARDRGEAPTLSGLSRGTEEWISNLPSHLRSAGRAAGSSGVPGGGALEWLLGGAAEAADADDEEIAGRARSMGYGAAEGATLGFSDELMGALGALQGRGSYEAERDAFRRASSEAREENPWLYGGSGLVAGAALPIPGLGGAAGGMTRATSALVPRLAAGTGRAVRAGAAGGAMAGAGMSEADLGTEAADLLGDIGVGAAGGGVAGGVLGGGAEALREVARAAPGLRTAADRMAMRVPSHSARGGEVLLDEMGGELPEAADTVRGVLRRAGWFPSPDDIVRVLDEDLASGGPSRPYEERLAGIRMPRERVAEPFHSRAAAGERSYVEAPEMAPLRAAGDRVAGPPRPVEPPGTPSALERVVGPAAPRAAPRPRAGPAVPVLPVAHVNPRRPTLEGPYRDVPELPPDLTDLPPDLTNPDELIPAEAYRPLEGEVPGALWTPEADDVPPGIFLDEDERAAVMMRSPEVRARAARAAASAPPAAGTAERPGRVRRARVEPSPAEPPRLDDATPVSSPPADMPRMRVAAEPNPSWVEPPTGVADLARDINGPTMESSLDTLLAMDQAGLGEEITSPHLRPPMRGGTRPALVAPPAGGPPRGTTREAAVVPPAGRRAPPARPLPAPLPSDARPRRHATEMFPVDEGMPVFERPEAGSRLRSAPGSVLYEMRAARERGFPVIPGARRGALEHGWRGVGSDLRGSIDEVFRRNFGDDALADYRAARSVEEAEIPIRRSAEVGAGRAGGASMIPARDVMTAHALSAMGAGPMASTLGAAGAGAFDRMRGVAMRERLLDSAARALGGPRTSAYAAGTGEGVRRTAGAVGRAVGAATANEPVRTPSESARALFDAGRVAASSDAAETATDVPVTPPAPASPPEAARALFERHRVRRRRTAP